MSAYVQQGYVEPGYIEGDNTATQSNGQYVEAGYVEPGYTEGDSTTGAGSGSGFEIGGDKVNLKFFVLKSSDISGAVTAVQESLAGDEAGILYAPASKKFFLVEQNSFTEFVSQVMSKEKVREIVRTDTILKDELVERVVQDVLKRIDVSVKLVADGVEIATPQIEHNGTEFSFVVPEEYSGLEYKVIIDLETW